MEIVYVYTCIYNVSDAGVVMLCSSCHNVPAQISSSQHNPDHHPISGGSIDLAMGWIPKPGLITSSYTLELFYLLNEEVAHKIAL